MSDYVSAPRLDVFRSNFVKGAAFSEKYEFPVIAKTAAAPEKALPFHHAAAAKDFDQFIHFYIDDRRFECLWNSPGRYLPLLQRFRGVITPDFSLYLEMPLAMQIWNTYRNRALSYWMQHNGVNIIPNVRWSDERSYDFAFEGLEPGGTYAVSTNGCIQGKAERRYFKQGLAAMVEALAPETLVVYSCAPDDIFAPVREAGVKIIHIENTSFIHHKGVV